MPSVPLRRRVCARTSSRRRKLSAFFGPGSNGTRRDWLSAVRGELSDATILRASNTILCKIFLNLTHSLLFLVACCLNLVLFELPMLSPLSCCLQRDATQQFRFGCSLDCNRIVRGSPFSGVGNLLDDPGPWTTTRRHSFPGKLSRLDERAQREGVPALWFGGEIKEELRCDVCMISFQYHAMRCIIVRQDRRGSKENTECVLEREKSKLVVHSFMGGKDERFLVCLCVCMYVFEFILAVPYSIPCTRQTFYPR